MMINLWTLSVMLALFLLLSQMSPIPVLTTKVFLHSLNFRAMSGKALNESSLYTANLLCNDPALQWIFFEPIKVKFWTHFPLLLNSFHSLNLLANSWKLSIFSKSVDMIPRSCSIFVASKLAATPLLPLVLDWWDNMGQIFKYLVSNILDIWLMEQLKTFGW